MTDFAAELVPTLFGTQLNALVAQVAALLPTTGTFGVDTGSADAGAVTLDPVPASLADLVGVTITVLKMGSANTGPYSLDVNGLGPITVQFQKAALSGAELLGSAMFSVVYDGTYFELAFGQGVVQNSDMAAMPAGTIKGNALGAPATPQDLSLAAIIAALGIPTALSGSQTGTPGTNGWKASINIPVVGLGTVLINLGCTTVGANTTMTDTYLTAYTTPWAVSQPGYTNTDTGATSNLIAGIVDTTTVGFTNSQGQPRTVTWVAWGLA